MGIHLVILNPGSAQGMRVAVHQFPFLIGRHAECHLRPANTKVSARHCLIRAHQDKLLLQDLGSTNGTYLNGELISGEWAIVHGDIIRIGPVHFQVRFDGGDKVETQPTLPEHHLDSTELTHLMDAPPASRSSGQPVDVDVRDSAGPRPNRRRPHRQA
jgi:pSer/pThr/pTyr-binding forkhead associated (FHA) protein